MFNSICEGCAWLNQEMESAFKSWAQQRAIHNQIGLYGKSARGELDYLKRIYERARVKTLLHQQNDHPEKGIKATKQDLDILIREPFGVRRH